MIRTINTENDFEQKYSRHLPFEELLSLLQQEGFLIKPDDYIEILKIVERYANENVKHLKYRIAPLVSTSESEQQKFYKVFDEYARFTLSSDEKKLQQKRTYLFIASGCLAFALLVAGYFYFFHKPDIARPPKASFSMIVNGEDGSKTTWAVPGDTVKLDASNLFHPVYNNDTNDLQLSWNIGAGWKFQNQRSITFNIPDTSPQEVLIRLKLESHKTSGHVSIDSQYLTVCSAILTSLEADRYDSLYAGDQVIINATARGEKNYVSDAIWIINDTDTLRNKGGSLSYLFDSAGNYRISFVAGISNSFTVCPQRVQRDFVVNKKQDNFRLSSNRIAVPVKPDSSFKSWLWLLLLLPVGGMLITYWLHRRGKRRVRNNDKSISVVRPEDVKSRSGPPYEVPFENHDLEYVNREPEMNLLFRAMRNKTEDECSVLNIQKSIHSMIRSGGVPSLVFSNRMKQQEYLILLDRSNVNSQQYKLFEYLVRLLCEENLNIERFHYSDFQLFYNDNFPLGISLQRMADMYKGDVLIIFGHAQQLIYRQWLAVDKEIADVLKEWEFKAILTPKAYRDWGANENALKKEIVLLPADVQGQIQLIQAIKEKQLQHDKYLGSFQDFYEVSSWYFTDIKEIRDYLNDDTLFQWLCAICTYPKLRWEVVIEIGKTVCRTANQPAKLNYTSLLKLVRIEWMQGGSVPERTRLELLKHLTVENEVAARETVLRMLEYPDLYFKDDHFFEEEKAQQQLTNQFILFANDSIKFKTYQDAYDRFRSRWDLDMIYDAPLRRYLDKREGDIWETPVKLNGGSPGLSEYFNITKNIVVKNLSRKFNVAYASAISLFVLVAGMLLFGKPWLEGKNIAGFQFVSTDLARQYQISFSINYDSCIQDPAVFTEGLNGKLVLNQNEYALNFISWDSATTTVPYYDLRSDTGIVELSWDNNNRQASAISAFGESNSLQLTTCGVKPRIYVRYYNPANNDSLGVLVNLLSSQYQIASQLPDSSGPSRIIYYSESDRGKADSIARLIEFALGNKIPIEFIREDRTPPAVPMVFINFTPGNMDSNSVDEPAGNPE